MHPWVKGFQVCSNGGLNALSKECQKENSENTLMTFKNIFFSRTTGSISSNLVCLLLKSVSQIRDVMVGLLVCDVIFVHSTSFEE